MKRGSPFPGSAMRRVERLLMIAGLAAVGFYASAWGFAETSQAYESWAFDQALRGRQASWIGYVRHCGERFYQLAFWDQQAANPGSSAEDLPRQEHWSSDRIRAFRESLAGQIGAPVARLRIPSIDLSVIVFEGTDQWTLNRGAGHIQGTALPGESGTVGIAGHRDGFFRDLREVKKGDAIIVSGLQGTYYYRVDILSVVDPEDGGVLHDSSGQSLALVTCYPFYFVGPAPKRFVAHAVLCSPGEIPLVSKLQDPANEDGRSWHRACYLPSSKKRR